LQSGLYSFASVKVGGTVIEETMTNNNEKIKETEKQHNNNRTRQRFVEEKTVKSLVQRTRTTGF
jgi:hypothetical protein